MKETERKVSFFVSVLPPLLRSGCTSVFGADAQKKREIQFSLFSISATMPNFHSEYI